MESKMAVDEILAKDLPQVILTMREMSEKEIMANAMQQLLSKRCLCCFVVLRQRTACFDTVSEIDQHIGKLLEKITARDFTTKTGVSFLELKFHLLLSYIIDLVYYLLIKTDGQPWEGSPAVERLVEIRTVLEKLRPIDQKMKYQIDKLIKTATTGLTDSNKDPLRFKPNPDNMATKLEDVGAGSSDEEEQKKDPVYVPPKVSAVPYDEGFEKGTRKERDEEKARKRALKSSLLQDLRDEYSEAPHEIREETVSWSRKQKEREEEEERTRYEEENMLRLPAKKMKKVTGRDQSGLGELTSFADLSALTTEADEQSGEYSGKSSRSLAGWKIRSKGKRKFGGAKKKKGFLKRRRK